MITKHFAQMARRPAASIRFSLLLLEEGEEYILDAVGSCLHGMSSFGGKLRLASKSLFFDPDDIRLPIARLPFSSIQSIEAAGSGSSSSFVVTSTSSISMKPHNKDLPYETSRHSPPSSWTFSLSYAQLSSFLPTLSSLFQAAKQPSKADRMRAMELILGKLDQDNPFTFDTTRLVDYSERIAWSNPCILISPLTRERGILVITDLCLYFQPRSNLTGSAVKNHAVKAIAALARRRSSLRPLGLEIFFSPLSSSSGGPRWEGGSSVFFVFSSEEMRESVICALHSRTQLASTSMKLLEAQGSLQGQEWMRQVTLSWQVGLV